MTEPETLISSLVSGVAYTLLATLLLFAAKIIHDFLTPYLLDVELATRNNVAVGVSFSGYLFGILIVFLGAMIGPETDLVSDLIETGGWALLGIILLNISRLINDHLILRKFCNVKEIVQDQNVGTGVVEAGSYCASALVLAGSIHGEGGSLLTFFAFFAAGQLALVAFAVLYDLITPYDIHAEIERDNVAAGVAFAGGLVAIGIILMHACAGNFVGWIHNFSQFGIEALIIFLLFPLVRWVFDKAIIAKLELNNEISEEKNLAAALLESTVMISFALLLVVIYR